MSFLTWFGPLPYKHLCDVWDEVKKEIASIDSIGHDHISGVKSLLSRMTVCDETMQTEVALSGRIAREFQRLIPMLDKSIDTESVHFVHQLFGSWW